MPDSSSVDNSSEPEKAGDLPLPKISIQEFSKRASQTEFIKNIKRQTREAKEKEEEKKKQESAKSKKINFDLNTPEEENREVKEFKTSMTSNRSRFSKKLVKITLAPLQAMEIIGDKHNTYLSAIYALAHVAPLTKYFENSDW